MSGLEDHGGRIVGTRVRLPFSAEDAPQVYWTILEGTKDDGSKRLAMPAGYMFKNVPGKAATLSRRSSTPWTRTACRSPCCR